MKLTIWMICYLTWLANIHHLDRQTSSTQIFYRMVANADELVYDKTTHSSLSSVARLFDVYFLPLYARFHRLKPNQSTPSASGSH